MRLKITAISHLRVLWFHISGSIMMLLALYFLDFEYNYVLSFGIMWLIYTLPAAWLHIEYWLKNQGMEFEMNNDGFIFLRNGKETKFTNEQIDTISIYMPPSVYKGSSLKFIAIENYYFARVNLKSGHVLTLTCLLTANLEDELRKISGVSIKRKKRLFCTTYL